ncbi:MAG: hypothetical protein IID39_03400, partial [Planctomycetes bacterium]|nr:hypothetical protein [Planctomycetota bacterium]
MKYVATVFVVLGLAGASGVRAQFTPGHVFVAGNGGDGEGGCDWGEPEGIVEVDLATGDITTFADCSDGINWPGGLRFTPDGGRLLVLMTGTPDDRGWVQAFNPDGTSEIILDASDGLYRPVGSNGLAFDRAG